MGVQTVSLLFLVGFAAKKIFSLLPLSSTFLPIIFPFLSSPFIFPHLFLLSTLVSSSLLTTFSFLPPFSLSSLSFSPSLPPSLLFFHPPFFLSFLPSFPSSPHLIPPPPQNLSPVTIHLMKNRAVRAGQVTTIVTMRGGQGEGSHEKDNKMINYWTTFSKLSFARGEGLVVCGLLWVPTAYVCVCIRADPSSLRVD